MIYEALLAFHVAIGIITGALATYAGIILWRSDERQYRPVALGIAYLAGFEILSGVMLSVLSLEISAISLCANIALYLSLVFVVEVLLFLRMKKVARGFPLIAVVSPSASGLAFLLAAIARGF